jgi:serine/threonine protein kinase
MLEVAEGMQHLHSEGVVHGDLHAVSAFSFIQISHRAHVIVCQGNVLLDSELHCKITDFGLTRHSEITVAASTGAFSPNFAAPELFGLCITCGQSGCDGCDEGRGVQHRSKTMKTDVYAFGCLYYAVRFVLFNLFGVLSIKRRYSLGLLLFTGKMTSKSCDS